ncbi:MAG: hypothetical protein JW706_05955 [Opitutales bacterium]|nr:hypothetical protein [Opitutales bacterium]
MKKDFRHAAADASFRAVENLGVEAALNDFSLCLPKEGGQERLRKTMRVASALFVMAFVMMMGGAVLLQLEPDQSWTLLQVCGILSGMAGFGVLFYVAGYIKRSSRKVLGPAFESMLKQGSSRPEFVGIEDAKTFSKFKLVPEDTAYLIIDHASCRLLIEGVLYTYSIRAEDVVELMQVRNKDNPGEGVRMTFLVGEVPLSMVLSQDEVKEAFAKKLLFKKEMHLFRLLRRWLDASVAELPLESN